MKVELVVNDAVHAGALRAAWKDPITQALILTIGTLLQLPSQRARRRVLGFVQDKLDEEHHGRFLRAAQSSGR